MGEKKNQSLINNSKHGNSLLLRGTNESRGTTLVITGTGDRGEARCAPVGLTGVSVSGSGAGALGLVLAGA